MNYVFKKKWKRAVAAIADAAGNAVFFLRRFFRRKPQQVKKVLVLRLDQMGDIVQTIPFFEKIKQKYPSAVITALVVKGNEFLLKGLADNVITLSGSWFYPERKVKDAELHEVAAKLIKEKYDMAFDLRGDMRNIIFLFFCGIKWNVGCGCAGGGFLLDEAVKYNRDAHEIAKNLALIGEVPDRAIRMNFQVPVQSVDKISGLFENGKKAVVVHPFTRAASKMWGLEKYSGLIKRMTEYNEKIEIFIIGSKEEKELLPAKVFGTKVHNMAGKLSLDESIELIKRAEVFVGNDSGPQYFAAYSGVKTCVIYGYTVNNKRWKPIVEENRFIEFSKPVACGPCESPVCLNKTHECMDIISVDEVFNALKHWL